MIETGMGREFSSLFPAVLREVTEVLLCIHEDKEHLVLLQKRGCQDKAVIYFDNRDNYWGLSKDLRYGDGWRWIARNKVAEPISRWFKRDGELIGALDGSDLNKYILPQFKVTVREMLS